MLSQSGIDYLDHGSGAPKGHRGGRRRNTAILTPPRASNQGLRQRLAPAPQLEAPLTNGSRSLVIALSSFTENLFVALICGHIVASWAIMPRRDESAGYPGVKNGAP